MTSRMLSMLSSSSSIIHSLSIYLDFDDNDENVDNENIDEKDALFAQFEIDKEQKINEFLIDE